MFSGMTNAILLLAMGVGYIVCYLAKREEGALKLTGYVIGVAGILLSAIILANNVLLEAKFCRIGKKRCAAGMLLPHHRMMKGQAGSSMMPAQEQPVK